MRFPMPMPFCGKRTFSQSQNFQKEKLVNRLPTAALGGIVFGPAGLADGPHGPHPAVPVKAQQVVSLFGSENIKTKEGFVPASQLDFVYVPAAFFANVNEAQAITSLLQASS
jgi:hypothetical protein